MQLHIFGDRILVRKCVNDHIRNKDGSVCLYRTDTDYEFTNWAEIIDVGLKCKEFTKDDIGKFINCPEWSNDLNRINESDFLVRERAISNGRLPLMITGE